MYLDEQLIEDFDDKVFEKKVEGEIDRETSRSEVVGMLMEAWVNDEGNSNSAEMAAPAIE